MSDHRRNGPGEGAAPRSWAGHHEGTAARLFDPVVETRTPQWTDELHGLDPAGPGRDVAAREAALEAASQSWRRDAERMIEQLAALSRRTGEGFTSDELYRYVGPVMGPSTNVVGALFSAAAKRGIIRRVGYRPSVREVAAGRIVSVWIGTGEEA